MKNTLTFVIPAVCGVIIDILSKWFVFSQVKAYETITLIPGLLNMVRSENKGVVFGIYPANQRLYYFIGNCDYRHPSVSTCGLTGPLPNQTCALGMVTWPALRGTYGIGYGLGE